MLESKLLRDNPRAVLEKVSTRSKNGYLDLLPKLESLEIERKKLQTEIQEHQHKRNNLSKEIGLLKAKGESADRLLAEAEGFQKDLKDKELIFEKVHKELQSLYDVIPNIPHDSVTLGFSEEENVVLKTWGKAKEFSFQPKDHIELTKGTIDVEKSAKLSGSRFVVLYGKIAQLHRALAQFMLDTHVNEHGYKEVYVPYLVNDDSLYGTGQFPKFIEDQFKIEDQNLWLIPTSEVSVTNLYRDEIVDVSELPLKFVCYSPCFRKEAGSYGKDMRGMFRQHQFDKVEMVQLTEPSKSYEALEEMQGHAAKILEYLELPYRVVALCTGDLGFQSAKTYDLEVWLPGQDKYREISSVSNTESFQARRMQARFRDKVSKKPEFLHTLNGSGLAVGRTLIAVIENYQDKEGNIEIPSVLRTYMNGERIIKLE